MTCHLGWPYTFSVCSPGHILRWRQTVIIHVSIKPVNYICILTSPKHTIRQCYVWTLHKQLLRRVINQSSDYQNQVVASTLTLTAGSPKQRGQFYAFMYKSMWCPLSKYWMVTLKVRQDHFAPVWQIKCTSWLLLTNLYIKIVCTLISYSCYLCRFVFGHLMDIICLPCLNSKKIFLSTPL